MAIVSVLLVALYTGSAALQRFDQGKKETAYFLGAITIIFVLAGVLMMLRDRDWFNRD